jgi:hypothetical protein
MTKAEIEGEFGMAVAPFMAETVWDLETLQQAGWLIGQPASGPGAQDEAMLRRPKPGAGREAKAIERGMPIPTSGRSEFSR